MQTIYNLSYDGPKRQSGIEDARLLLQYQALKDLTTAFNVHSDPQQALYAALSILAARFGVEYSLMMQLDARSEALIAIQPVFRTPDNLNSSYTLDTFQLQLNEFDNSLQGFLGGKAVFVNKTEEDNFGHLARLKIRNFLIVPFQLEGQLRAVCCLINRRAGLFDENDIEDLEALLPAFNNLLKTLKLEKQLETEQRHHQAMLNAAMDGFVEVSPDKRIIMFSKGAEEMTGWRAQDAIGRQCHEILSPHSLDNESLCHNCPLERAFKTGQPVSDVETLIPNLDGEDNWVATSYNFIRDEQNQVSSGVITIKDIFRLKALSDELRQQFQQQEALLAVNNAINGLSNIEEIYRVSLDKISSAITFDLGTIHAIDPDSQRLILMALKETSLVAASSEDQEKITFATGAAGLRMLETSQTLGGLGLPITSDEENYQPNLVSLERGSLKESYWKTEGGHNSCLHSHQAHDCEAILHNEPYMSVNLPGKAVCKVLDEFEGLQSHLCVPIRTGERVYGVLHLASRKPYAFWGSHFVLAWNICKQIAVAAERARLFEQVDLLARTDALTGLYNKLEFKERLEGEIRRAERKGTTLSLAIIDLDRLKWVNDCFGHAQGDLLLARLGELIRVQCRAGDIAFRYGGDELCILFPDTSTDEAKRAVDRLRQAARDIPIASDSDQIIGEIAEVTMSVGVACYNNDATTASELFERADAAMYRAKETGKDRSVLYDPLIDINKANYRRRDSRREYTDERLLPPHKHA